MAQQKARQQQVSVSVARPTDSDWVKERLRRWLPPAASFEVNPHPDGNTVLEVWVNYAGPEPILGRIPFKTIAELRAVDEESYHDEFFKDYVKPFLQE